MGSPTPGIQSPDQRQERGRECSSRSSLQIDIAHDSHSPPINEEFLEESLLFVENALWYAHIANNLATGEIPGECKEQDKKYFAKIHSYYWETPFLFKPNH